MSRWMSWLGNEDNIALWRVHRWLFALWVAGCVAAAAMVVAGVVWWTTDFDLEGVFYVTMSSSLLLQLAHDRWARQYRRQLQGDPGSDHDARQAHRTH